MRGRTPAVLRHAGLRRSLDSPSQAVRGTACKSSGGTSPASASVWRSYLLHLSRTTAYVRSSLPPTKHGILGGCSHWHMHLLLQHMSVSTCSTMPRRRVPRPAPTARQEHQGLTTHIVSCSASVGQHTAAPLLSHARLPQSPASSLHRQPTRTPCICTAIRGYHLRSPSLTPCAAQRTHFATIPFECPLAEATATVDLQRPH